MLVNAKINATSRNNRRTFQSDNRLYWTSQKTYGLGTDSPEDAAVDQKYDYFRFFETMFWRVVPNTYLGAGFLYSNHRNVRPADAEAEAAWATSPYVTYSEQNGFDLASQTSAGVSLNALIDSRDGAINPSRGWYARLSYAALFKGFLGGASNHVELIRRDRTRSVRHTLRSLGRCSVLGRSDLRVTTSLPGEQDGGEGHH